VALAPRVLESCWLIAVGLVPVLYDPHSNAGYEVIKMAAVQMLGLVTAFAAVLHAGTGARSLDTAVTPSQRQSSVPLVLFFWGALAVAVILSTSLSINRGASIWGGRLTYQGGISLLSLIVLGASLALHLRTPAQLNRLLTVMLLTGFPVALYALLQRAGLDPLMTRTDDRLATSFAGQPIYLAGYLLMLLPLALWRWWALGVEWSEARSPRLWISSHLYGLLSVLLVAALLATEKRGPLIALTIASVFGSVLLAAYDCRWKLIRRAIGLGMAVLLGLTALAAARKSGLPLATVPVLSKLSMIIPVGGQTGDAYRQNLWAKAPEVLLPSVPLTHPDGIADRWSAWRLAVGYGPETFDSVIARFSPFAHRPSFSTTDERFHNGFWDAWQSLGGLGLVAWLGLTTCVFASGYVRLGLLPGKNAARRLATFCAPGAALGAAVLGKLYGSGFAGLGVHLGIVAGLTLAPLWSATRRGATRASSGSSRPLDLLTIALLTALLAHIVDMAFIYPTGSTSVLAWTLLGGATALGWRARPNEKYLGAEPSPNKSDGAEHPHPPALSSTRIGLLSGLLSALVLIGMLHAFVYFYSGERVTPGEVLRASLTRIRFVEGPSFLLPLLFFPSWLLLNCGFIHGLRGGRPAGSFVRPYLLAGGFSLLLAGGYALVKADAVARVGPLTLSAASSAATTTQLASIEAISSLFLTSLLLAVPAVAYFLRDTPPAAEGKRRLAGPLVTVAAVVLIVGAAPWLVARKTLWKENCILWGRILFENGHTEGAAVAYRQALDHAPEFHAVRITLAETLITLAAQTPDPRQAEHRLDEAETVLRAGRAWSEWNDVNYFLGTLHLTRALRESDRARQSDHARAAREAFGRALVFAPRFEPAWFEAAVTERVLGEAADAAAKLQQADAITHTADPAPWGEYYSSKAMSAPFPGWRDIHTQRAIHYLDILLSADPKRSDVDRFDALLQKGNLFRYAGRLADARDCFKAASGIESAPEIWQARTLFAFASADLGDFEAAVVSATAALSAAPPEVKRQLMRLIAEAPQTAPRQP